MIFEEHYTLSNGVDIPKLGLGTWFIPDDHAADAVCQAAALGYRHIDTAQAYANERGVGEGICTCGVARNELFVTTKLAAEAKTYAKAVQAIDGSLETLGLDYIDLMLIHSPQPWNDFRGGDYAQGNRCMARHGGGLPGRKAPRHRHLQFQRAGYGKHSLLLHGRPDGKPTSCAYRQYAPIADGILPEE